jgi:hypothetical protein
MELALRKKAHNKATSEVRLACVRIHNHMFPVKTKRLLSAIATTEQTLLYSARGLVLEDDDNQRKALIQKNPVQKERIIIN